MYLTGCVFIVNNLGPEGANNRAIFIGDEMKLLFTVTLLLSIMACASKPALLNRKFPEAFCIGKYGNIEVCQKR